MKLVRVVNRTRGAVLAERAELATSHWARFWGLMGRRDLAPGTGMVLQPGGGIHTWFMRIPIDVILVVTFTRAAAAELRERVRRRLVDTARHLASPDPAATDALLIHLATGDEATRTERLRRVEQAVSDYDTATITTKLAPAAPAPPAKPEPSRQRPQT